ncbi:TPA: gamma-mobile-trio protein GmtX [Stenotrophomonas maltophilia]|uniref:gamma-mobile-trio protein GmtX n=1 Tax=Stenotrophomonas TaxID=40323 RepID=UPI00066DE4FD|nr:MULTISPECIES: gamma-mobile-trio protein GmtX [Stenotrophomonas]EMB2830540.1 hypothetical protein [Stenotrophomonas maltophilia]MBA0338546.1 alpha/beta hydrolase [Stenotrophomonas maltophilia]MBA0542626.1 alpha/beta hydrolase [Stenotrophomonas maltophilia]MBH1451854.1 hypothetical protein [Stenotrophomonas maltophilia]MBH1524093.1 hypothetical protein [Stenotrophomonas maltophilia]
MTDTTNVHPDAVLAALLAKGGRSNRQANLARMHEICSNQHATGSRDFSISTIGRLAEAEGVLKGRALYNAASADYRSLIEAWAAYAGPPLPRVKKVLASDEYLMRIEDPAIRSIMQGIIAERDRLKSQLNLLKAHTQVTVDRRPLGATISATGVAPPLAVFTLSEQFTPSEREALRKAISPDYLQERGLKEGTHGEIINERGRVVLEVGFARAIRKILGDSITKGR